MRFAWKPRATKDGIPAPGCHVEANDAGAKTIESAPSWLYIASAKLMSRRQARTSTINTELAA
jgi:hypothetical protein